jgi:SAM-dependent methyltransferase
MWSIGARVEISFWSDFLKNPRSYFEFAMDCGSEVQDEISFLLDTTKDWPYYILDVGSGPLTRVGKRFKGRPLVVYPTDPLASSYRDLMKANKVNPPVMPLPIAAERLSENFPKNYFDLVFAQNSIDHCENPEKALLEMLYVLKRGRYILMKHRVAEGVRQGYVGLHQHNGS